MAYLALNKFAGSGAVMQVELQFKGNTNAETVAGVAPYFKVEDVRGYIVTLATSGQPETQQAIALTRVNSLTFRTAVPVPVGKELWVRRQTENWFSQVNFTALQTVTEADLDALAKQSLFLAQETQDLAQLASEASTSSSAESKEALLAAQNALGTAQSADAKATTALSTANAASSNASAAQTAAASAVSTANSANASANAAVATANGIDGKATTALSNSQAAVATANAAQSSAGSANTTAAAAVVTANNADTKATAAVATANSANTTAGTANTTATAANTKATNAESLAASANTNATAANTKATNAVNTANAAQSTANGIDGKATTALSNSQAAVSTANTAKSTADGVDGKATTALNNSVTATNNASSALSKANSVEGIANSANSTASAAQTTANNADTKATNAQNTANGVDAKATNALSTANTAKTTADNAASVASAADTKATNAGTAAANAQATANSMARPPKAGHIGEYLRAKSATEEEWVPLVTDSFKVGDTLLTARSMPANWHLTDGALLLQSAYLELFGVIGVQGTAYATSFTSATNTFATGTFYGKADCSDSGVGLVYHNVRAGYARTMDHGATWELLTWSAPGTAYGIIGFLWLRGTEWLMFVSGPVNTRTYMYRSTDNGTTWTATGNDINVLSTGNSRHSVDRTAGIVLSVGDNGSVSRSLDWGATWSSAVTTGSSASLVQCVSPGVWVLMSNETSSSRRWRWSTDNGATWVSRTLDTSASWTADIPCADSRPGTGTVVTCSTNGRVTRTTDNGATVSTTFVPDVGMNPIAVLYVQGETWICIGRAASPFSSTVARSDDDGKTWQAQAPALAGVSTGMRSITGKISLFPFNTATTYPRYFSEPAVDYDSSTQFRLPTLASPAPGMRYYIKMKDE